MREEPSLVTKVGAVILRVRSGTQEVLLIQPKPKPRTPDDLPPMGLPRGTRMYRNAAGNLVDADHDGRTAPPAAAVLEPVRETMAREMEEEAGLTTQMLARATVHALGPRLFASTKKTPYPIYWFVVVLAADDAATITHAALQDSLHSEWVTLERLQEYVESKKASRGYIAVAQEALGLLSPSPSAA